MGKVSSSVKVLFILLIVVLLVLGNYFLFIKLYSNWGRTLLYSESSKSTNYPGRGSFFRSFPESFFVNPRGEGKPFFVNKESILKYEDALFEKTYIPAQVQLKYVAGIFVGWENIPSSTDKYMLVKYKKSDLPEKYRVSYAVSNYFGEDRPALLTEKVGFRFGKIGVNNIENIEIPELENISFEKFSKIIKIGDAMVLLPVVDIPILSKTDENGNYFVSQLILRRVGGKIDLRQEIERIKI